MLARRFHQVTHSFCPGHISSFHQKPPTGSGPFPAPIEIYDIDVNGRTVSGFRALAIPSEVHGSCRYSASLNVRLYILKAFLININATVGPFRSPAWSRRKGMIGLGVKRPGFYSGHLFPTLCLASLFCGVEAVYYHTCTVPNALGPPPRRR